MYDRFSNDHSIVQNLHQRDFRWIGLAAVRRRAVIGHIAGEYLPLFFSHVVPERVGERNVVNDVGPFGVDPVVLVRHQLGCVARGIGAQNRDLQLMVQVCDQSAAWHLNTPAVATDRCLIVHTVETDHHMGLRNVRWHTGQGSAQHDLRLGLRRIDDVVCRDVVDQQLDARQVGWRHVQIDHEGVAVGTLVARLIHTGTAQFVLALCRECRMYRVGPSTTAIHHRHANQTSVVVDMDGVTGGARPDDLRCGVVGDAATVQRRLYAAHVVVDLVDVRHAGGRGIDHQRKGSLGHIACHTHRLDDVLVRAFALFRQAQDPVARSICLDAGNDRCAVVDRDRCVGSRMSLERGRRVVRHPAVGDGALNAAMIVQHAVDHQLHAFRIHVEGQRIAWCADVAGLVDHRGGDAVVSVDQHARGLEAPLAVGADLDGAQLLAVVVDRHRPIGLRTSLDLGRCVVRHAADDGALLVSHLIDGLKPFWLVWRNRVNDDQVVPGGVADLAGPIGGRRCELVLAVGQLGGGETPMAFSIDRRAPDQYPIAIDLHDRARCRSSVEQWRCVVGRNTWLDIHQRLALIVIYAGDGGSCGSRTFKNERQR